MPTVTVHTQPWVRLAQSRPYFISPSPEGPPGSRRSPPPIHSWLMDLSHTHTHTAKAGGRTNKQLSALLGSARSCQKRSARRVKLGVDGCTHKTHGRWETGGITQVFTPDANHGSVPFRSKETRCHFPHLKGPDKANGKFLFTSFRYTCTYRCNWERKKNRISGSEISTYSAGYSEKYLFVCLFVCLWGE